MHIIPRTNASDHASPYKSSAWTTAVAIVRERMLGARENKRNFDHHPIENDNRAYVMGRYDALCDLLAEMEERK